MNDDAALLRRYTEEGSEDAFTELVRRHVDLVFSAALRRTNGDAHLAADVAQQVFTSLARNAPKLARHTVLSAWLHTATRNAALKLVISDQRRRLRETEALALQTALIADSAEPEWEKIRPVLDAAIDELPEADRAAVVLRFLERRAFSEIGAALRVSEDAARMRTDRALDKLRLALARRGITSTAAALSAVVAGQPLLAAPAGLAATLASQSLVAVAATGSLAATAATFMTAKTIATASVAVLVAFAAGVYFGPELGTATPAVPAASSSIVSSNDDAMTIASLRAENQRLRADASGLGADIARLKEANATLAAEQQRVAEALRTQKPTAARKGPTLGMARWEVQRETLNNLLQIDMARKQFRKDKGQIAGSINDLVGHNSFIRAVRSVNGEEYSALSMNPEEPMTVTAPDGLVVTFDPLGKNTTDPEYPPEVVRVHELEQAMQMTTGPSIAKAFEAYRAAHGGRSPPDDAALIPYFPDTQSAADFMELREARKAAGM